MATVELAPSPQHYAWWFPGSPIKVHLDLQVVRRMQEYLQNSKPGVPQEGLLFGKASAGITEILDFLPACGADVAQLIPELAKDHRDLSLVGYYRTEPGDALRLNDHDLSLAELFFEKPHQVFLLLQETGFGSPNATFFFHEENRLANFAFLEFPFDASELANQERDRILRSQQSLAEQPDVLPAVATAPAKPEKRGSWRAVAWVLLAAILLGCAGGLAFTWFREHRLPFPTRSSQPSAPPAPQPAPPPRPTPVTFGLQVERQNNDLKLVWDRQSSLVLSATSGTLSINDGKADRKILLSAAQLRNGNILYAASASQIQLQLTVNSPEGTVSESVLVILPTETQPEPKIVERRTELSSPPDSTSSPLKPFRSPVLPHHADQPELSLESPPVPAGAGNSTTPQLPSMLATAITKAPPMPAAVSSRPLADADHSRPSAAPTPFLPPSILSSVGAIYPTSLRSMSLQPKIVAIEVSIDQNGRVVKSEYLAGKEWVPGAMVQSALTAIRFFKFKAAQSGDRPVPGDLILRFTFKQN